MGLLDTLAGGLGGQSPGGGQGMVDAVMGLINQHGGIQGLAQTPQSKGLGEAVSSWISTGENLPVSGDQLQQALGSDQMQATAQKLGLSTEDVSGGLAQLLPQVIDHLTPNGQLPEGSLLEQGLALFKSKLLGG